jgi:HlyD family secretion protein
LSHPPKPINTQRSLRAYQLLGFAVVIALLVGIGGWGALASINGAVIAPATVAVESYTKKVQHREGGIVSEIRVKEGDNVQKGDVLLVLSDAETRAELAIIGGQLDEVMGWRARLEAERDRATAPSFMPELLSRADEPAIAKILAGQRKLFESETASLKGQQEQLEERMAQLEEQISGLTAQLDSNDKQTKLINEELKGFKGLVEKGLIELTRVRERQGAAASLEGQRGEIVANIAQAKGKISEIRLQIIQLQDDSRVKILADLGDAETKMTELLERQAAAQSKLARTTIRSPVTGYVYHVSVHTIGGVVGAGKPFWRSCLNSTISCLLRTHAPMISTKFISAKYLRCASRISIVGLRRKSWRESPISRPTSPSPRRLAVTTFNPSTRYV